MPKLRVKTRAQVHDALRCDPSRCGVILLHVRVSGVLNIAPIHVLQNQSGKSTVKIGVGQDIHHRPDCPDQGRFHGSAWVNLRQ